MIFTPKKLKAIFTSDEKLFAIVINSSWLMADRFIRLATGFLIGSWVARYLGPQQYGEIAYVIAYIAIFQAIASLGLDNIIVRDIAVNQSMAGEILATSMSLRFVVGIICWLIAVSGVILADGALSTGAILTILIGSSLFFQAADIFDLWFQSQSQSRRTVYAKLVAHILSNAVKVWLIYISASLYYFGAVIALDAMLSAIGMYVAYRLYPSAFQWQKNISLGMRMLKESWPFLLSGILVMIYMRIDQIMIKNILGDYQLGIYAAVLPLATLWQFIPMTLATNLRPLLSQKKAQGESEYWNSLEKICQLFSILAWGVCIVMIIIAAPLVYLLFGDKYENGANILMIYIFTNISINLGIAQGMWVVNERLSLLSLYKTVIGALVCIVGNYLLLPTYGLYGAAWSAVISIFCADILSNIIFSRRIFTMQIRSLSLTWLLK